MCMGTNMFMDVLLMVIDLLIQICCSCDIMFYAIYVIRKIHSPVILMLCCPLQVTLLRVGQSRMTFSTQILECVAEEREQETFKMVDRGINPCLGNFIVLGHL